MRKGSRKVWLLLHSHRYRSPGTLKEAGSSMERSIFLTLLSTEAEGFALILISDVCFLDLTTLTCLFLWKWTKGFINNTLHTARQALCFHKISTGTLHYFRYLCNKYVCIFKKIKHFTGPMLELSQSSLWPFGLMTELLPQVEDTSTSTSREEKRFPALSFNRTDPAAKHLQLNIIFHIFSCLTGMSTTHGWEVPGI